MGEQNWQTCKNAPAIAYLTFHSDVGQMIEVVDFRVQASARHVLHIADKVPVTRLVAIANGYRPALRIVVIVHTASRFSEHAKPGRALSCGDSTLARGRAGQRKQYAQGERQRQDSD